jgi:DNA-binding NarL/FixJ family response regulator
MTHDVADDNALRVVIAEDHPVFREGLHAILDAAGLLVVGEAADGDEAVALAAAEQPDVVLMDVNMPGCNGIDATRRIVQDSPHIAVLILTMFDDDDSVFAAMRAGARGYLLKGAPKERVVQATAAVAAGEAVFGPGIATRVLAYFQHGERPPAGDPFPELTEREREVLGLIAAGRSNGEIATRLVLSPKTVRNHISNIFTKLQVADRAQAIVRAREAGMG